MVMSIGVPSPRLLVEGPNDHQRSCGNGKLSGWPFRITGILKKKSERVKKMSLLPMHMPKNLPTLQQAQQTPSGSGSSTVPQAPTSPTTFPSPSSLSQSPSLPLSALLSYPHHYTPIPTRTSYAHWRLWWKLPSIFLTNGSAYSHVYGPPEGCVSVKSRCCLVLESKKRGG
ncbi:hypothetical protein CPB83DRAFT_490862 [Crepidotus variabilis]|uniref:Uncharacterized protein n=1 Tax=Crepidotus variabilis TaxID=179855 RepID=A0A9P6ERG2_9AGAR|nr:hypothetical protein CPB83DRAFT_490862 [Crepidotus variabilis]